MAVSSSASQSTEILLLLGRVDGKLDAVIASTKEDREAVDALEKRVHETTEGLDSRIRVLETGHARLLAYSAFIGAAASAVVAFITVHWKLVF